MSLRLVGDVSDIAVDALVASVGCLLHVCDIAVHALDISKVIHTEVKRTSHLGVQEGTDTAHDGKPLVLLFGICRCMEERGLELLTVVLDTEVYTVLLLEVCLTFGLNRQTLDDLSLDYILHRLADDMVNTVT